MSRLRWAAAGLLVTAAAVGGLANAVEANYLDTGWHTTARGAEGADLSVGTFQVHVHGAASSPDLEAREVLTSPGAFVVIDLSYATTDAWDSPREVVLLDGDGREFTTPSGFGSDGQVWEAGPDIWLRGTLLFEVPAEAVADLTLEFRPEVPDARLPGTVLQVPLEVSPSPEPLVLERATVLPEGER